MSEESHIIERSAQIVSRKPLTKEECSKSRSIAHSIIEQLANGSTVIVGKGWPDYNAILDVTIEEVLDKAVYRTGYEGPSLK